jgi:hypothetical protein
LFPHIMKAESHACSLSAVRFLSSLVQTVALSRFQKRLSSSAHAPRREMLSNGSLSNLVFRVVCRSVVVRGKHASSAAAARRAPLPILSPIPKWTSSGQDSEFGNNSASASDRFYVNSLTEILDVRMNLVTEGLRTNVDYFGWLEFNPLLKNRPRFFISTTAFWVRKPFIRNIYVGVALLRKPFM